MFYRKIYCIGIKYRITYIVLGVSVEFFFPSVVDCLSINEIRLSE